MSLPDQLVDLLRTVNGGSLNYHLRLSPGTPHEDLAAFTGWFRASEPEDRAPETILSELAVLDSAYFRGRLPTFLVPLARTGGEDDTLLMDLTRERLGSVWAWITGIPPGWGLPTEDRLHFVAGDLDDLFSQLFIDEDMLEIWPHDPSAPADDQRDREAWLMSRNLPDR